MGGITGLDKGCVDWALDDPCVASDATALLSVLTCVVRADT